MVFSFRKGLLLLTAFICITPDRVFGLASENLVFFRSSANSRIPQNRFTSSEKFVMPISQTEGQNYLESSVLQAVKKKIVFAMHFISSQKVKSGNGLLTLQLENDESPIAVMSVFEGEVLAAHGSMVHLMNKSGKDLLLVSNTPSTERWDVFHWIENDCRPSTNYSVSAVVVNQTGNLSADDLLQVSVYNPSENEFSTASNVTTPEVELENYEEHLQYYLNSLASYIDWVSGFVMLMLPPEQAYRQAYLSGEQKEGLAVVCVGDSCCPPIDSSLKASHKRSWLEMINGTGCEGRQCVRQKGNPKKRPRADIHNAGVANGGRLQQERRVIEGEEEHPQIERSHPDSSSNEVSSEGEKESQAVIRQYTKLAAESGVDPLVIMLVNTVIDFLSHYAEEDPVTVLEKAPLLNNMVLAGIDFYKNFEEQAAVDRLIEYLEKNNLLFLSDRDYARRAISPVINLKWEDYSLPSRLVSVMDTSAIDTTVTELFLLDGILTRFKEEQGSNSQLEGFVGSFTLFALKSLFNHRVNETWRRNLARWLDGHATYSFWRSLITPIPEKPANVRVYGKTPESRQRNSQEQGSHQLISMLSNSYSMPFFSGRRLRKPPPPYGAGHTQLELAWRQSQQGKNLVRRHQVATTQAAGGQFQNPAFKQPSDANVQFRSLPRRQQIQIMRARQGRPPAPVMASVPQALAVSSSSSVVHWKPVITQEATGVVPSVIIPGSMAKTGNGKAKTALTASVNQPLVSAFFPSTTGWTNLPSAATPGPVVMPLRSASSGMGFIPGAANPLGLFWYYYHVAYYKVLQRRSAEAGVVSVDFLREQKREFTQIVQSQLPMVLPESINNIFSLLKSLWIRQYGGSP